MQVLVIGGGVIGMSAAIALGSAGHDVTIAARAWSPQTTSDVAAAFWYPFHAEPAARCAAWARASLEHFRELAALPDSGVMLREAVVCGTAALDDPFWAEVLRGLRPARRDELPADCEAGAVFETAVVEMPRYLAWLRGRADELAITCRSADFDALPDAAVVVHCAGLGARELAGDPSVHARRGQLLRVDRGPERCLIDFRPGKPPRYVIPRRADCVVGGTLGIDDEDLEPRPRESEQMLADAAEWCPDLASARVLSVVVGLRPGRPTVRLEAEADAPRGRTVIHCYGHGGSGVSLAWGCAVDVAAHLC